MLKKLFNPSSYSSKYKKIRKSLEVGKLQTTLVHPREFNFVWNVDFSNIDFGNFNFIDNDTFYIFGLPIDLNNLDWHTDKFSYFTYPQKRFDKLNARQYFDKGIDLVFPWEQSRFYFGIHLAQKYFATNDAKYYYQFRNLVLDWIDKNPYLHGVNWLSTMDISIRAMNWIVTINLFKKLFIKDVEFKSKASKWLIKHGNYINTFLPIYQNGLTTNHTTSSYTGLLFLGLTFNNKHWVKTAVRGLIECMNKQVYNDGVDFEGSIPYHRLVLEMFAYSTVLARANKIDFPSAFYSKLFKMFEFTAAYIDHQGNAPQVGDNDSGRALIFNTSENNNPYENEHDHFYLLQLGEKIFDYKFPSLVTEHHENKLLTPEIEKIKITDLGITPRQTQNSIFFEDGKVGVLKNNIFSLLVSCFPLGQNGKGGHNNLDTGSFTLSINGKQTIVDPGTITYTRNKTLRDKLRSYEYHNVLFTEKDTEIDLSKLEFWRLNEIYKSELLEFTPNRMHIKIHNKFDRIPRERTFELFENSIKITDVYKGKFQSKINLHPEVKILTESEKEILTNICRIKIESDSDYNISDYLYSPHYGNYIQSTNIIFYTNNILQITIETI